MEKSNYEIDSVHKNKEAFLIGPKLEIKRCERSKTKFRATILTNIQPNYHKKLTTLTEVEEYCHNHLPGLIITNLFFTFFL